MSGWTVHEGLAVVLPLTDVDTDQLIPARFMSASRAEGYGRFLLHDLRAGDPAFPLDRHPDASILVTGPNFGCGSSREAAVYALVDAGIRVVVAASFADIFAGNAANNGLLTARIADAPSLLAALADAPLRARADLETRTLTIGDATHAFELPDRARDKLMSGRDDIDMTRAHAPEIATFRDARRAAHPWAWPAPPGPGRTPAASRQGDDP